MIILIGFMVKGVGNKMRPDISLGRRGIHISGLGIWIYIGG